eukprot:maker-scaffold_2-snap-gene-23.7-mRNA-1 protein AED:0.00 eAED:0.00 QI:235/1/1/1/1/1/2/88/423
MISTQTQEQHNFQEVSKKNKNKKVLAPMVLIFVVAIVATVAFFSTQNDSHKTSISSNIGRATSDDEDVEQIVQNICSSVETEVKIKVRSTDYISIIFDQKPNLNDCSAFLLAAAKLSSAVAPTDHNLHLASDRTYTLQDLCGVETRSNPVLLQEGENIQDLTIVAVIEEIDGFGGLLAFAGPCYISSRYELPLFATMKFDSEDLEDVAKYDKLNDLVLHEMMHTLGFGTLWDPFPGSSGDYITSTDVLEDAVYDINGSGDIVGRHGDNQPKYVGEAGVRAYQELTGEKQGFLPIQGTRVNGEKAFDEQKDEGVGSIDKHVDKDTFQDALMTYFMNFDNRTPLTKMSIASLADLGYTVDDSVADEYVFSSSQKASEERGLRGKSEKTLDLSGDVLPIVPRKMTITAEGKGHFDPVEKVTIVKNL